MRLASAPAAAAAAMCAACALLSLGACDAKQPGEPPPRTADATAEELEAAADNATDETQAQVLRNQANALEEVAEGDEEKVEGEVKVINQ